MADSTAPSRKPAHSPEGPNPSGLCQCGCGGKAPLAKRTQSRLGLVKGQPQRYIFGHRFTRTNTAAMMTIEDLLGHTLQVGECREWQRSRNDDGYGRLTFEGKRDKAHRVAYVLAKGPVPDGLCVCHTCDNPPCCNPAHLFLGTKNENNLDKQAKGRARGGGANPNPVRGSSHGQAKLTDHEVMAIRAAWAKGEQQTTLARQHGVSLSTVHLIVHRKHWRHLP
jgi:hypothetical protein